MDQNKVKTFKAILATDHDGKSRGELVDLALTDLPDDDVLVQVAWSTLNYKDALAVSGAGKICRYLPMVCGIDLAGAVVESRDPRYQAGDAVLVNGFGMSESHWGGYSQYQRVKPEWLVRIPESFSAEQTMALGTAGYTSMLCVQALQDHGIKPGDGPILVTGATGGVGSVAVMLLARMGYSVTAASGRVAEHREFLERLGADAVIERSELDRSSKPLESERWSGVVDAVGGDMLACALAQTRYGGAVAACGLAGSFKLPTTVMPFILRGVALLGIDSVMAPQDKRQRAWDGLAEWVDRDILQEIYTVEPMARVPELAQELLSGKIRGRVVINVAG